MNGPRISVAMCTRNGSRFLSEQLESIAAQVKLPDELIICDDCSTDNTIDICRKFVGCAPFPVSIIVNDSRLGSTKNFEKAISLCRSEIIALCDQDDIWHPQKLNRIAEVFHHDRVGAVSSDADLIDENSQPLGKTLWSSSQFSLREQEKFESGQGLKVMLKHPVVAGTTMGLRSEFRDLVLPIPPDHIHDHWIALLIASISNVALIKDRLVQYRKHAAQQLGPSNIESTWQLIQVSRRMSRDDYILEAKRFSEAYERLCDCCATFRPHPYALRLIRQKITHERARGNLSTSKVLRLPSVIRETATCRYWLYSNGLGSVAKDVLI
jgi:glycosyltransferase involved in cell wall biosynthesis